jgi:hypothetical protein
MLGASAGLLAGCATVSSPESSREYSTIAADLETYVNFGPKNAGGPGDTAAGAWIETQLAAAGFAVERQAIAALAIEERDPALIVNGARVAVAAHTLGSARAVQRISAPLRVWGANAPGADAGGAIVVAHLPQQRWSSAEQPAVRQLIERAFTHNAAALVLVTHGPTRELIKLNRRLDPPVQPGPVALIAPRAWADAAPRVDGEAVLELNAREQAREAFNVVARLDRGAPSTLIVSTPRSGWTMCAGERGPGIAAFLALADWAPRAIPTHNLLFLCTSAHEFENAGNAAIIEEFAPRPEQTAFWLHLGAGFAARDWHEAGGQLTPLPSADPQRFLVTSPHLLETARTTFAGLGGLEAPYSSERGASGELSNIIAAGYPAVAGMLGTHRFHHVAQDDMRCIDPAHTHAVIARLSRLVASALR